MKGKVLIDGRKAEVEIKDDILVIDGKTRKVRSSEMIKKKKVPTFNLIITLVVILMIGAVVYVSAQYLLGSEDQSDPYLRMSTENDRQVKLNEFYPASSLFLIGSDFKDLQGDVDDVSRDGYLVFSNDLNVSGLVTLNIVLTGDVDELMINGISVMEITMDMDARFRLDSISFLVLDEDKNILDSTGMTLDGSLTSSSRSDKHTYTIGFKNFELGEARNAQSGSFSSNRACIVSFILPDGMPEGEHAVSVSFGPDFYHSSTSWDLFLGLIVGAVTFFVAAFVFLDMTKSVPALVINTKEGEITLDGDKEELSRINYQMSKIRISRMREGEKKDLENVKEAPKKFKVSREEREKMKEQLKDLPGKPKSIMIQQCPECGSNELYYESGFLTGYVYHCKKCDYIGSFIIEKELDFEE